MTTTAQQNDPIYDEANGTRTSVTGSASILTPSTSCVFAWIGTDAAIVINTNGAAAVDNGTSVYLPAAFAGIIPVRPGTQIFALSLSGTAIVRAVPMIVRP